MKTKKLFLSTLAFAPLCTFGASYELTITNGSNMHLSPFAVYVRVGPQAATQIGQSATPGLIQLCQSGTPSLRESELKADNTVISTMTTSGLLNPGEKKVIEVEITDPMNQGVHFETMYGATKDACALGSFGPYQVEMLEDENDFIQGKDTAVTTGAFTIPALPTLTPGQPVEACQGKDAIGCVRALSVQRQDPGTVQFLTPYLPSLITYIEKEYGAREAIHLILPSGGAVNFSLKKMSE